MYRATTPKHTFLLPFDTRLIDALVLTYSQKGVVIIEKYLDDVTLDDKKVIVTLTQEETMLFNKDNKARIQMRVKSGSSVIASQILEIDVNKVLNDEVI